MWAAQGKQGLKTAALVFSVQLEAGKTILSLLLDPGGSFVLCGCSNGQIAVSNPSSSLQSRSAGDLQPWCMSIIQSIEWHRTVCREECAEAT